MPLQKAQKNPFESKVEVEFEESNSSLLAPISIAPSLQLENPAQPDSRIECDICGGLFNNRSNLETHRITHTVEHSFECWLCHET